MSRKQDRFAKIFALLVVGCLIISACAAAPTATQLPAVTDAPVASATVVATEAATTAPVTITDALGRTVTFDTLPQRIVVAGKATPLILNSFYMFPEAASRLVAYEMRMQNGDSFLKVLDPTLAEKTKLETNASAEQIAPSTPDLVIMKTYMKEKLGDSIEALDIKVMYVDMETPDSFYSDIRNMGAVLGDSSRAEEIVSYYQGKVDGIKNTVSSVSDDAKPAVLVIQYSSKENNISFTVPPMEYLQTLMVNTSAGSPVWTDAADSSGWTVVTLEQIAAWNPAMIFVVDYSNKAVEDVAGLQADPQWAELEAVKNDQLFAVPTDFLSWDQPDSRWILGLTWMSAKIQPDLFKEMNISDEITSFYKTLYNLDDQTITDQILPLFKGS